MSRRLAKLNPYELHKHLINEYILTKPGATKLLQRDTSRDKTDRDVLREHHRFLWEDGDTVDSWEKQLAKKYYDKLFREYCIADLSRYRENKVNKWVAVVGCTVQTNGMDVFWTNSECFAESIIYL